MKPSSRPPPPTTKKEKKKKKTQKMHESITRLEHAGCATPPAHNVLQFLNLAQAPKTKRCVGCVGFIHGHRRHEHLPSYHPDPDQACVGHHFLAVFFCLYRQPNVPDS